MKKSRQAKAQNNGFCSSLSGKEKDPISKFPPEVIEKLAYYVYRLVDPRNGETFYIGKGRGNRVFDHVTGTIKLTKTEKDTALLPLKQKRIQKIHGEGLEVIQIIHRHGIQDENTAYKVEAALIDAYPGLTNAIGGHGTDYGVMSTKQIMDLYTAEDADFSRFKGSLIIKITQGVVDARNGNIYEAVRKAWRLKRSLLVKNDVPYVFASLNGIIRGVFKVTQWLPYKEEPPRICFEGLKATNLKYFIGKRIPAAYREQGAASPIRYI